MSVMEQLRRLVSERLAAAAEEIFGLVKKTVADYQEEVVRSRSEIIQLRQQIEQLTVLQPRVFLFKEDHSQPPEEEKKETQQVKEEQLDVCIISDLDSDSSEDVKFTRQDSETVTQTDSQLLPSNSSITVTISDDDGEWIGNFGSGLSHYDPSRGSFLHAVLKNQSQTHLDQQMKEEPPNVCVVPNLNTNFSNDATFTHPESETTAQTDSQLLPWDNSITVTLNEDHLDVMRIGNPGSGSSSSGQNPHRAVSSRLQTVCCYICDLAFLRESHLIEHINTSHPGHKAFQCNECHKEFNRKYHLTMHLRVHTGEKPYICPFCGRSFTQNSSLTVHLRQHTGEKPYHCKTCGKMVSHSKHLKRCLFQSKVTAGTTEKPFRCVKCGKTFRSISELNMHINIHKAHQLNGSK